MPEEVTRIERKIRRLGQHAKLNYHQWQYAAWQLYKNHSVGFQTRDYFAEDSGNRHLHLHVRFGWNEHLGLYAMVKSLSGEISYYGHYIDEKEIKKYKNEGERLVVVIPSSLKTKYKEVLKKEGTTMQDHITKFIRVCVGENFG
jgi:hypothetical protein